MTNRLKKLDVKTDKNQWIIRLDKMGIQII